MLACGFCDAGVLGTVRDVIGGAAAWWSARPDGQMKSALVAWVTDATPDVNMPRLRGARPTHLRISNHDFPLLDNALTVGVVNVTPDSYSGDGTGDDAHKALDRIQSLLDAGADILSIGAEASAHPCSASEEFRRLIPVLEGVRSLGKVIYFIETRRPCVAKRALDLGAAGLNDLGCTRHSDMVALASQRGIPVVVLRRADIRFDGTTVGELSPEDSFVFRVVQDLLSSAADLLRAGLDSSNIILDPTLGMWLSDDERLMLLKRMDWLSALPFTLMVAPSNTGLLDLKCSHSAITLTSCISIMAGARLIRVHDVKELAPAIRLISRISANKGGSTLGHRS